MCWEWATLGNDKTIDRRSQQTVLKVYGHGKEHGRLSILDKAVGIERIKLHCWNKNFRKTYRSSDSSTWTSS